MGTKSIAELYNMFTDLIEAGDEKAARAFLVEHINEFPEDLRKKIIFEFFKDALDKDVESSAQKVQLQKEGMDSIKEIEKEEKILKDELKINDVRSSLKNDSN